MAMYMFDSTYLGHMVERKGSMHLRSSKQMLYGNPTRVSGWHQKRDTEPKDYDVMEAPLDKKNFFLSSYERLGSADTKDWSTTTKKHLSQIKLKGDYEVKFPKRMISKENCGIIGIKRETGCPERGFGSVLPHHSKDHPKIDLNTTYVKDYVAHYPYKATSNSPEGPDYSTAYKKCNSQFTDVASYKRRGKNTWQDESGIYANNQMKRLVFQRTCPITPHL